MWDEAMSKATLVAQGQGNVKGENNGKREQHFKHQHVQLFSICHCPHQANYYLLITGMEFFNMLKYNLTGLYQQRSKESRTIELRNCKCSRKIEYQK